MVWEAVYADGWAIFAFCMQMTGSAMAASQTKKNPAGYRLVNTRSLVFKPSTDMRGKRRQSHL